MHQLTIPDLFKSWALAPYCCLFKFFDDKLCCHVWLWLTANTNKLVKKLNPDFLNVFCELNREITTGNTTQKKLVKFSWLLLQWTDMQLHWHHCSFQIKSYKIICCACRRSKGRHSWKHRNPYFETNSQKFWNY